MAAILMTRGASGAAVGLLKQALVRELGPEAVLYPGLLDGSADFGADTEAALRRWQGGTGLVADGIAGPHGLNLLAVHKPAQGIGFTLDLPTVRKLFPQTKPSNIVRYLPYVTDALEAEGLIDRAMVFGALATIRAETAGFVPISEYPSKYNTVPGGAAFSAYEPDTTAGKRVGNTRQGDGFRFRGRGFVQLTGRYNYTVFGQALGLDLAGRPDLANAPEVAAALLAKFLSAQAAKMRAAIASGQYGKAREAVNGGSHGLKDFEFVLKEAIALQLLPAPPKAGAARRPVLARVPRAMRPARTTRKDPPDLRDRLYQPAPVVLPDAHPAQADVTRFMKSYASLVLDQGEDSSCTGYALACVINFALWGKAQWKGPPLRVSARMLYDLARRHDEYAGEDYEGSSCRGALKGWFHNGVCRETDWPEGKRPKFGYAERALDITLGVYYRIDVQSITDMQAAIVQAHAIYVSAFTHDGWMTLLRKQASRTVPTHTNLPVIPWDGRASHTDGHAFALVGFNERGFIVQNSWGAPFGVGGFAILSYEDWLTHGMDAWVASLGVPRVNAGRIALAAGGQGAGAGPAAGFFTDKSHWWDDERARQHSIVLGKDGRVAKYVKGDELTRTLQVQACEMPDQWFRASAQPGEAGAKKRIVVYAHGGLNDEGDAIDRARAMGRYFTGNGCYPLFLVWQTGLVASLKASITAYVASLPKLFGGPAEWFSEKTDAMIEKFASGDVGRGTWTYMKDLARFSCTANRACDHLATALQGLESTWGDELEIHLVGHSAGSIILGYFLQVLAAKGLKDRVGGIHLYAPACTVQFANRYYGTHADLVRRLWLSVLSDEQERADSVGPYRKSLLYLVSQALEPDLRTPLLGMEKIGDAGYGKWDGSSTTNEALGMWRDTAGKAGLAGRTTVVSSRRVVTHKPAGGGKPGEVEAVHGSFDNNVDIVRSTLQLIRGGSLAVDVDDLRGF